jgi:regulator of protease activity HflC (stomatin/prohibitin superfamily)
VVAAILIILAVLVVAGLVATGRSLRVVQQYEQGIVFRFGKVLGSTRGPGLHIIRPVGDRMQKVNMQIIAMAVPAQEGITRDNVSVRVDAVVYFRVVDPIKATVNVQNYMFAVSQQAQTSLRSIIGQSEMDQLLAERASVNKELREIIDEPTEGPWGIRVERVEIKDVSLPEGMKRSMSRQAEAERERRARIITADGEFQASKRLAAAANVMARDPAALQLRLLQTVVEVAAERNSTLVLPIPVELLRFFDKFSGPQQTANEGSASLADFGDAEVTEAAISGDAAEPLEIPEVPPIPEIPAEPPVAIPAAAGSGVPDLADTLPGEADYAPPEPEPYSASTGSTDYSGSTSFSDSPGFEAGSTMSFDAVDPAPYDTGSPAPSSSTGPAFDAADTAAYEAPAFDAGPYGSSYSPPGEHEVPPAGAPVTAAGVADPGSGPADAANPDEPGAVPGTKPAPRRRPRSAAGTSPAPRRATAGSSSAGSTAKRAAPARRRKPAGGVPLGDASAPESTGASDGTGAPESTGAPDSTGPDSTGADSGGSSQEV